MRKESAVAIAIDSVARSPGHGITIFIPASGARTSDSELRQREIERGGRERGGRDVSTHVRAYVRERRSAVAGPAAEEMLI